ncbi:protein kinase [Paenibacillus thailandensis]|uniref:Protein kinase n=1 Tax=Paenibacillus thailandensis TaxID=393250 RepID=A0ABW5R039_9BACL
MAAYERKTWKNEIGRMIGEWRDYPLREGSLWAGEYRIESFIGMGSYGQAYAVREERSGRRLLLKRNRPSKKELGIRLLRRENEILKALDHPQIPRWHRYVTRMRRGEEGLLMELLEGPSVERAIGEDGLVFTETDSLKLVRELMRPLSYLHEAGYVHRDVRIPNVVMHGERVVLIDYGLACRIGEQLPDDLAKMLGDHAGAAPSRDGSWNEVRRRMRHPYPASDLYGTGHFMLFLLYSGYRAEEGQEERGWEEELELSPGCRGVIRRLLADKPEDGLSSAAEYAKELDKLLART